MTILSHISLRFNSFYLKLHIVEVVTFLWMGVGGCGVFIGGFGWVWRFYWRVWVDVTFLWLGVGGCGVFMGECGWM